jgi:hypothetical protein
VPLVAVKIKRDNAATAYNTVSRLPAYSRQLAWIAQSKRLLPPTSTFSLLKAIDQSINLLGEFNNYRQNQKNKGIFNG